MRVLACGLCGSDVEKIGVAPAGTVLGHEVVARRTDGARIALIHHLPCGECERCRAGHESTCERFAVPTIVPGGFAEEVEAADGVELPDAIGDEVGTYLEPLACVLRGAERVPGGRVLVVGQGFVGRLFAAVLQARGDDVYATDARPERCRARARRPGRRRGAVRPGGAARRRRARRHGPRLLPRRAGRPRSRLPERADADRLALGDAAAHAGGARAAPRSRSARADGAAAGALRATASRSTAPAGRSRSCSRREGAPLPRPGRPAARGGAEPGAGTWRRARPGRGRSDRRHRPEDVPARPPGPPPRAAKPVRTRVLRDRRRHGEARRRRQLGGDRRARRADRASERRLRGAAASSRPRSPRSTCCPCRRGSRPRSRPWSSRSRAACAASSGRESKPATGSRSSAQGRSA